MIGIFNLKAATKFLIILTAVFFSMFLEASDTTPGVRVCDGEYLTGLSAGCFVLAVVVLIFAHMYLPEIISVYKEKTMLGIFNLKAATKSLIILTAVFFSMFLEAFDTTPPGMSVEKEYKHNAWHYINGEIKICDGLYFQTIQGCFILDDGLNGYMMIYKKGDYIISLQESVEKEEGAKVLITDKNKTNDGKLVVKYEVLPGQIATPKEEPKGLSSFIKKYTLTAMICVMFLAVVPFFLINSAFMIAAMVMLFFSFLLLPHYMTVYLAAPEWAGFTRLGIFVLTVALFAKGVRIAYVEKTSKKRPCLQKSIVEMS